MICKVVEIVEIVDIVDFHLVVLALLEVVLDVEAFNPYWIQIVHDYLGHAHLVPGGPRFLIQNHHAVRPRKSVKIWQVNARKRETDNLYEALLTLVYVLVDGGQDCVV